jgi:hypothetical protein
MRDDRRGEYVLSELREASFAKKGASKLAHSKAFRKSVAVFMNRALS